MSLLRSVKSHVLGVVRRGRPVAWCPEWMNLGNLLYISTWAFDGAQNGEQRRVLLHPSKVAALSLFPTLREQLFIERSDVRLTDRRVMPWSGSPAPESDRYEYPHLRNFVEKLLLPGSPISAPPDDIDETSLVLNVRRGDYFSVPEHRAAFGIDTTAYSLEAVRASIEKNGTPSAIVVVSDDTEWCRMNLRGLSELAPLRVREGSVSDDLSALAHARRLVLPNSTFSYWGGYIGDMIHPGREVIAPWFFDRNAHGGKAGQLRPGWHRIDDIPGGWVEPER